MFDFTKEVVINDVKSFGVVNGARGTKFNVHGGGNYHGKYVVDKTIYKTLPQAGSLSVLKINATELVAALQGEKKHFTLNIEMGLDRDARGARGDWASNVYYFKKPLLVDAYAANWEDANVELGKLLKAILTDYKFVHVLQGSDDAAYAEELGIELDGDMIHVVGSDSNIKVRKITVAEYVCDVRCEGSSEEPADVYAGRPEDAPSYFEYTPNVVDFGTYEYLLHNLRMPTFENYRFASPAAVEMPKHGAQYIQYSFMYCVPRPGLGGLSVAGQFNHSTTTHVFFVEESIAGEFEAKLAEAGMGDVSEITVGGPHDNIEILPDSFATTSSVSSEE